MRVPSTLGEKGVGTARAKDEPAYPASSHSFRLIPARRRIRVSRSTLMSPRWGFGMVSARSPRVMYGCTPPPYGPAKPAFLSRRTSSFQETGVSLSANCHLCRRFDPVLSQRWDGEALAQP